MTTSTANNSKPEDIPHVVRGKAMALPARRPAKGYKALRVSVSFDDAQFDAVRLHARNMGCSFGEAVRTFLNVGLAAHKAEVNTAHNKISGEE